jgi:hypothetical protein
MTVAGGQAARLFPLSPLTEVHQLLVDQVLDGWPQVETVDEHGVIVHYAAVRFTVFGAAASFKGGADHIDVEANNHGRAVASGLHGDAVGEATVEATLPGDPEAPPLRYLMRVVAAS